MCELWKHGKEVYSQDECKQTRPIHSILSARVSRVRLERYSIDTTFGLLCGCSPFVTIMPLPLSVNDGQGVDEERFSRNYVIGLLLAVSSCLFIGSSFIIKKVGLLRLTGQGQRRAGAGGYGYLRQWIWWCGLITSGFGSTF